MGNESEGARSLARSVMLRMSREQFEQAVVQALDGIPEDLGRLIENVAVVVEDEPSKEELQDVGLDPGTDTLFGLYQGVALPERDSGYGGVPPDRIVIYRRPLLAACRSRRELLCEIRDTVIHEVGHYFGLPEDALP